MRLTRHPVLCWRHQFPSFLSSCQEYGYSALMWASGGGHDRIVHLLVRSGAFVNTVAEVRAGFFAQPLQSDRSFFSQDGTTALLLAAEQHQWQMVQDLLSFGANPKARNKVSS